MKDGSLCAPLIPGCFSQSPGIVNEKAYQDFMRKEKIFCKALKKGAVALTISARPLFYTKNYSQAPKSLAVGVKYKYAKSYIITQELYFE